MTAAGRELLRRARRFLPVNWRQSAFEFVAGALVPQAAGAEWQPSDPIVVAGLFATASGIGESARLCHRALTLAGLAPLAFDLSGSFGQSDCDPGIVSAPVPGSRRGLFILHVNAPEVLKALWLLGRYRRPDWRVTAFWAWELSEFPTGWESTFRYLDEIWTPSRFCAEALRHPAAPPIRVVPHPVALVPDAFPDRARFGLPEHTFVVLCLADARSSLARKNPFAAIEAFQRAFGDRPDTLLVVKTRNLETVPGAAAELRARCRDTANIRLFDRSLSRIDSLCLIASCDVLLSLHRAEGFGLPIAEAMRLAKPVIATAWSGNLDFMAPETAELIPAPLVPVEDASGIYGGTGRRWADPDPEAAVGPLRRLAADPGYRHALGLRAQEAVQRQLSAADYLHACGIAATRPR